MAKLFYTIDEAAAKLGKSQSDLTSMVQHGQLEEFRMHDQVHFKRTVIDQLVVDDVIDLDIPADDGLDSGRSGSSFPATPDSFPGKFSGKSSGEAFIDDLKFDDDVTEALGAKESEELDLDLDEGLMLSDSGASAAAIPNAPAPPKSNSATPPRAPVVEPLDLLDSADSSAIAPLPSKSGANAGRDPDLDLDLDLDLDSGLDSGLDLGLDLGLDDGQDSKNAKPVGSNPSGGIDLLDDSRGDSATAMASDASGSMAPPPARKPVAESEDFLDLAGMGGSGGLSLETVGSGSGMMDDSTDSDQSTVGAALLDDGGDETFGTGASLSGGTGLFAEPSDGDGFDQDSGGSPVAAASSGSGVVAMHAERVDSAGSGMGLGLMAGSLAAIVLAALVVMGSRMGGGSILSGMIAQDVMVWGGGLAIATIIAGGIGFFVGRAIE